MATVRENKSTDHRVEVILNQTRPKPINGTAHSQESDKFNIFALMIYI